MAVFNRVILMIMMLFIMMGVQAQKMQIIIADYENKPNTDGWWKDNANVKFSFDDNERNQVNERSKSCLYVRWDSIPHNKPFTWFTDLKADTFAVAGMEEKWKAFKENTWLSFWCKAGKGDTIMLHYLVLSKGHMSKWGAVDMVPLKFKEWTFVKVRFADLQYENWGAVKADFDLKNDVRCFEVGLRISSTSPKGFVDAWFDNLKLTNYEPFE
jgi:hypothetical protein